MRYVAAIGVAKSWLMSLRNPTWFDLTYSKTILTNHWMR